MRLTGLPGASAGGGLDLRSNFGKLSSAFKYRTQATLGGKSAEVLKVIKTSLGDRGKFNSQRALAKMKEIEKSTDFRGRRDIKQFTKYLETNAAVKSKAPTVSALARQEEKSQNMSKTATDPNKRGDILRRTIAYQRARDLGAGEYAKSAQTRAFSKLKAVDEEAAKAALGAGQQLKNTGLAGGQSYNAPDNPYLRRAV